MTRVTSDGLGAGADLKFFVDSADVGVDGGEADAEFFGNFFVEEALGKEVENFAFAGAEVFGFFGMLSRRGRGWRGRGGFGDWVLKGLDDFAGDVGAHGRTASENFAKGFEELAAFGVFKHVAGGAGGESFEDVVGILINGEHDEQGVGELGFEASDAFDAAEAGEVDVAQNDARLEFGNFRKGRFNGAELGNAFEVGRTIDPLHPNLAIGSVVFDHHHGDAHVARRIQGN